MAKLNQIIAVVSGKKTKALGFLTATHHWNKDAIAGITRTYTPLKEDGDQLPPENKNVQVRVVDAVKKINDELVDFYNTVATQEVGNTIAKAKIVVDTRPVIDTALPVSVLLFLEKQFIDLRTFISNIPTLPTDRDWRFDPNKNCYVSEPVTVLRTQKVLKNHIKFEPTQYQPGQSELHAVDETVGKWTKQDFSGAIPEQTRASMLDRVDSILTAIKLAREEANSIEVTAQDIGKGLLGFVFEPLYKLDQQRKT